MVGEVGIGKKVTAGPMVLAVVLLLLVQPSSFQNEASSAALAAHAPIVIDGDDDICRSEHVSDDHDTKTGITNCHEADGSDDDPYLIRGWTIDVSRIDNDVPRCKNSGITAAVNICDVTHTIVLREIDIRYPYHDEEGLRSAGVNVERAHNVILEDVTVESGGFGVYVRGEARQDPPTEVTLKRVQVTPFIEDLPWPLFTVFDKDEAIGGKFRESPMLELFNATVTLLESHIDATLRTHAIRMDARDAAEEGTDHLLRMEENLVENAAQSGVHVQGTTAQLHRNTFRNNSHATAFLHAEHPADDEQNPTVGISGANIFLSTLEYTITRNHFQIPGHSTAAIQIETSFPGSIKQNHFEQDAPGGIAVLIDQLGCNARTTYNDLNDLDVVNYDDACRLIAHLNWWGGEGGPDDEQAHGSVETNQWLTLPIDELPVVTIDHPLPDTPVHRSVTLSGSAHATTGDNPLTHIEATLHRDDWSRPLNSTGIERWELPWDLSNTPRGPLSFWVRGCGELECGVPERVDVRHVPIPPVPIAGLTATPDLVQVGETIHLNASQSYSPEGETIVAYRFGGVGDEHEDWVEEPTLEVAFDTPGTYVVTADVMDENGYENQNAPQVTVRVLTPLEAGEGFAYLPAPGAAAFLLVIAVWGFVHRRSRR